MSGETERVVTLREALGERDTRALRADSVRRAAKMFDRPPAPCPTSMSFRPTGDEEWYCDHFCPHPLVELRWWRILVPSGRDYERWGYQCLQCGNFMTRRVRRDELAESSRRLAAEFDPSLRASWGAYERQVFEMVNAESKRAYEIWRAPYHDHIESLKWQCTRLRALKRAGHRCEECGDSNPPLQVHHLTYARLGNEADTDLQVLCKPCHQSAHNRGLSEDPPC